jgi:hypothetical protein
VASSSDINLAGGSPYVVTVHTELTGSPTYLTSNYLKITVKNACTGSLTATPVTLNSDWTTPSGDSSINYAQVFDCPGETLTPTYSFSTLDPRFVDNSAAR